MLSTVAVAQDAPAEEKKAETKIGGYLDTYMKQNFSRQGNNGYTSFTPVNNSFELGMASIYAEHKMDKASVFIDLGFGPRAEEFIYNNKFGASNPALTNSQMLIKQAYLSYEVMDGLKFTMGSWATHIGVELVNAYDNRNYSMAYAFTNGPFFNTGVKADYAMDEFNFMLGLSQPTDFRSSLEAGTVQKTVIGQVGYAIEGTSVYLNGTSGSTNPGTANYSQGDIVFNQKIDDKLSLTINATMAFLTDDVASGTKNWYSTVGYLKYDHSDKIKLTYRLEYFEDKDGITASFSGINGFPKKGLNVISNTLSLNYVVGNLVIIPEIRVDQSSNNVFLNSDAKGTKTNGYALLAAAYKF